MRAINARCNGVELHSRLDGRGGILPFSCTIIITISSLALIERQPPLLNSPSSGVESALFPIEASSTIFGLGYLL